MRFATHPHPLSWGIDCHARRLDLCSVKQPGEMPVHRHLPAGPEPVLQPLVPSWPALGVGVAGILPWDGLADVWARHGMPLGLGHALSRQAMHRGQATNETVKA
jgi:hypothetical protein